MFPTFRRWLGYADERNQVPMAATPKVEEKKPTSTGTWVVLGVILVILAILFLPELGIIKNEFMTQSGQCDPGLVYRDGYCYLR